VSGWCWQTRHDDVKGFPTPTSLLAGQRQYNKSKKPPRKNGEEVPEPFPPPTLKAEIYNVADYVDIDAHAGKVCIIQIFMHTASSLVL